MLLVLAALVACGAPAARKSAQAGRAARPLAQFELKESLGRSVHDELVHFDFDVPADAHGLVLSGGSGVPLPSQVAQLVRAGGRARGQIWTVVSLEPRATLRLQLHARQQQPAGAMAETDAGVWVREQGERLVVGNGRVELALPRWPGKLPAPVELATLSGPFDALRSGAGEWLGEARWRDGEHALRVREASTRVVERGPVRAVVERRITFADGRYYRATLTLGARQDAVLVSEESDVEQPAAALELSLKRGLAADHVFWQSQWASRERHGTWALFDSAVAKGHEQVVCTLRPWSFWWLPDIAEWAGFYRAGSEPLLGVMLLRPSRWSPEGSQGFARTEVPVKALSSGELVLSFPFAAGEVLLPGGSSAWRALHREWALTAGRASEHVVADGAHAKLRQQLVRYGEFPLDQLKSYGFEPASGPASHLIFQREAVARARRLALDQPDVKAEVARAAQYLEDCGGLEATLEREGPEAFYKRYVGHQLQHALPTMYLGSDDPLYARMLAAVVKGLARSVVETFLEAPPRPALGAFGPWFTETITRLLVHYDLIAGSGLLDATEEAELRAVLVFAAHVLSHPDYWNLERGLNSGNPNMTSMILLPRGLLGLSLRGHPKSDAWLHGAEAELDNELKDWVSPGGAWIESPFYQVSSLDGMFLFAQALRNVTGRDAFARAQFKETLDFSGFLLTPPDRRFARAGQGRAPMVLPSIGHAFAGTVTPFHGWMAAASAASDAAFSARQQFFWERQNHAYQLAHRASGMLLAVTDPTLPAAPPRELGRAFPDFGSVSRSSWTDPRASYLLHRTGPTGHHFDDDQGSLVYYAKGAPLCLDWGNLYEPVNRGESYYHNRVSFDKADSAKHFGTLGKLVDFQSLPATVDYSEGESASGAGHLTRRHLLHIKARDPLGANYVLVRDSTQASTPGHTYYWNLWCLGRGIEVDGQLAHFPGQFDVDLDVHVLAPVDPQIERDHWSWKQVIYVWRDFSEEQYGMRVAKTGDAEDFFMLLHPRAGGQRRAQVRLLAQGAGAKIVHEAGTDHVLFAPGKPAQFQDGAVELRGETALARRDVRGRVRLALVRGGLARLEALALASDGSVAIERDGKTIRGESSGAAQRAVLTLDRRVLRATLDERPVSAAQQGRTLALALPAGAHTFAITLQ